MTPANDPLRPQESASFQVSALSRSTWHALLSSARSLTHLPYRCSNIKTLLNQTPSIPECAQVMETIGDNSVFLEGHATWTVSSSNKILNHNCELPPTKKTLSRKVYIGESCPGVCNLSNDYFSEWPGFQPLTNSIGNYLAVFVLGWSYVLSSRLIELRRRTTEDRVVYTDNMAQWDSSLDTDTGDYFELDIGCDRLAEVRWWAAVLAGGRGWEAILTRESRAYFPPWECHLNSSCCHFRICHHAELLSSIPIEPPSSADAQEYLCNFARHHDAFDQLICALTAIMTLPMHNRLGASITLPRPISGHRSRQQTEIIHADQVPTFDDIPRYMAFSGTSGLLASCLLGSLWEPGIPCNLASEWLNPAMKEITSTLSQSKSFPIIWAMSERRPNLAPLWLGAAITGLLPRIFQVSTSFLPTIYLEGVTWTQSPQSFMDPSNHRLVKVRKVGDRDMISREDEFRLLFLTDTLSETYGNPPLCPYSPFGEVDVRHTSLQVRLHLSCDHRLVYRSWEWECQKGESLSDSGPPTELHCKIPFKSISLSSIWLLTGIVCAGMFKEPLRRISLIQPVSRN